MAKAKKKSSNMLVSESPAIFHPAVDYRREDDHRTVTRAGEIMRDKERMKGVKEHHKKLQKDMEKACK